MASAQKGHCGSVAFMLNPIREGNQSSHSSTMADQVGMEIFKNPEGVYVNGHERANRILKIRQSSFAFLCSSRRERKSLSNIITMNCALTIMSIPGVRGYITTSSH
ncbi:hypothetical protein BDV98DRAFT_641532 [Pterulicium gracile]|uniref:Uncharacterized protein n=1 Tax=Pterulicium gracile TaxID=1884261 RepID=A0A5C3QMY7_9AGAR|nr:hypothetical protein BDV98DRAFT_641532 [Pterula gracilis]